jgi:hypothetical protein
MIQARAAGSLKNFFTAMRLEKPALRTRLYRPYHRNRR